MTPFFGHRPLKTVFTKQWSGWTYAAETGSVSIPVRNTYLRTIRDFPQPKNITDIRSWFGVVNQVSYAFSMADRMLPFRKQLKSGTPFHWDTQLESLFQESKDIIISEIEKGVRIFHKSRRHALQPTGPKQELVSGCYKSTAHVLKLHHSVVGQDGKSLLLGAASHPQQNHVTLL